MFEISWIFFAGGGPGGDGCAGGAGSSSVAGIRLAGAGDSCIGGGSIIAFGVGSSNFAANGSGGAIGKIKFGDGHNTGSESGGDINPEGGFACLRMLAFFSGHTATGHPNVCTERAEMGGAGTTWGRESGDRRSADRAGEKRARAERNQKGAKRGSVGGKGEKTAGRIHGKQEHTTYLWQLHS